LPGPVLDLASLQAALSGTRARVVLTNGVFDLLHVGHLRYLRAARGEGDVLVVGINADSAVHKAGRPLVPERERAELVAALEPVDYVVIFSETTADTLLEALRPAVYVKGADYAEATLPEAATARSVGARLVFVPLVPDVSTSTLVERLSGQGRTIAS
jgi:rfaE bifunctional protein nucleotidyltransferase chain/domain